MTQARIVISFSSPEDAESSIDDVVQLFMRRNPLDEPDIRIDILDEDGEWRDTRGS